MSASLAHVATWAIILAAVAGVIIRPWKWPEAIWAVGGGMLLVATGLLPLHAALLALGRGGDVYLFLVGMMLLSEIARGEGLFDWLAAFAVRRSGGSGTRLFTLIYAVGTVVTAFLSNDAAAVVLTPAVFAAARAAGAEPLPYLFVCAFIANAASFVLPISNPANLVLYASHMPALLPWLGHFLLPSALSIAATFAVLLMLDRKRLAEPIRSDIAQPTLPAGGWTALAGLLLTAIVLLGASAADLRLGLPTCLSGLATSLLVLAIKQEAPWRVLGGISWAVLPLVAGLFVLVEGLDHTGVLVLLAHGLHRAAVGQCRARRLGRRRRHRRAVQPDEQPAGRPDRRAVGGAGASAARTGERAADRRRSRAQFVDHRLARDHPLADRAATRGGKRVVRPLPGSRRAGDAAGPAAGARRLAAALTPTIGAHQERA